MLTENREEVAIRAMPTAEGLLREPGLRVTPQRLGILETFLENSGDHWTAEQIRASLLARMPGLARGTTYKVLEELARVGLVEEIPMGSGGSLFGLRLVPHHHFTCSRCGRWFDMEATGVDQVDIHGPPGFVVQDVRVVFRGLCPHCGATGNGAAP